VQQSFERLADKDVESQMSYMVAGVASYETPSDDTFVVHLKNPQSDFLTLVASPFGPKVINPAVLKAHAADDAKAYLAGHVAGTGPYTVSSYTKGQQYVLTRNAKYWGAKPHFATVSMKIIPSAATQLVNLRGGSLDIISGQPIATVQGFAGNKKFSVASYPLLQKAQLHLKVTGALADPAVRAAVRQAIDRPKLVQQVWGEYATESTQMYPLANVPKGTATDDWTTDAAAATSVLRGKTISLGYSGTQSQDKQVAETLQTQLEAAGATIKLVPTESPDTVYSWSSAPDTAPDMFYEASYPDSTHPDTWARLFWYSDLKTGGVLNYLVGGTKEADVAIDAGLAGTGSGSTGDYEKAGDLIHDQVSYITVADLQDTYILRSGLQAKGHWLTAPKALDLATVTER
jgi:peptide/nickel transport system substrate-binding protein